MSKIYEALNHAYKKKGKGAEPPFPVPLESAGPADIKKADRAPAPPEMQQEMLGLFKMIDALLPETKSKFIQFIGCGKGEGTSTIVREFAKVAADQIGHSVLLLDADRIYPSQSAYFSIPAQFGWIDALKRNDQPACAFYRVEGSNVVVSPSSSSSGSTPEIFNSPVCEALFKNLREEYQIVLVDSAPYFSSPDGLAIASKVDGIVLVVEAETTKWQAVKDMKNNMERVGGKVLGVILNKRQYYIPNYIYKHL